MDKIYYKSSYKFRVAETFEVELVGCPYIFDLYDNAILRMPLASIENRNDKYFLVLEKYFGSDGATGAFDSKNFVRGFFTHDALLEMIGLGLLPAYCWKPYADEFLIKLCKEDGMWWLRRKWVYEAVSRLGDPQGSKPRKVYSAP